MAGTDTPKPAEPSVATSDPNATAVPASQVVEVGIGRRVVQQLVENPLQSLFGAAIIALLTFTLTSTHARFGDINERFDDVNRRIDDQNANFNARFDEMSARIDDTNERITRLEERMERLEASVAEINLKLTALIAALNMSAQVDAAQEGRLIEPAPNADR